VLVNAACGLKNSESVLAYLLVTGNRVNIRSGPGTSYGVIGQVEEGDVLEAVGESNGWYKVRFQGKTGWIAGWLVEVHTTKPPARGEPGTLDVRCREDAGGVAVTITGGEDAEFSWKELSGPQRLVITVPGVTVVRTPLEISVNKAGLEKITTRLQGGSAEVVLAFASSPVPIYYRVEKGSPGVLNVNIPYQINRVGVKNVEDGVDITLGATAPLSYNFFRLSNPSRLVFDFSNFTLIGSLLRWQEELNQEGFTRARLSQYQDGVVRLVVEVTRGVTFTKEARLNGCEITLKFRPATQAGRVVVIDPGHGGSDPGAIGPSGVREKDVNLAIAMRVVSILRQEGVNALLTHSGEGAELSERTAFANSNGAEVFVSIHSNSSVNPALGGTATYTYAPVGTSLESQRDSRLRLASLLEEELVNALGLRRAGVFEENFYVLRNTQMPAALVEVAFLSNPSEEQMLVDPDFQNRAAQAIARAIIRFLTE
ncbi:MAG: N-acetylmuramoyl-L-alanine amidase, partial [Thermacetogeniaceae bacterium]